MVRPCKKRCIRHQQNIRFFKPAGVPARELEFIEIQADELEAMRLVDVENMDQEQAAERMQISRATVGRLLARGRTKLVTSIVTGKGFAIANTV